MKGILKGNAPNETGASANKFGNTSNTGSNLASSSGQNLASDTGLNFGAQSSGNLGQGFASGLEKTGSNLEGAGNLSGGLASGSSSSYGGSGQTSNLQSNFPSGSGRESYSSSSSGLPSGKQTYSYSSGGQSLGENYSSGYSTNLGQQQTSGLTSGNFAQETHLASTIFMEKREKPTIVRETVLPQEKIEVQPIIHREREQLEVHEVVQPMHERDIAPTNVRYATLPAQVKAEVRESDVNFQNQYRAATTRYVSDVETKGVQREYMNKAPILEEHVSKKIIEEIQPVLYKETVTPTLIEETQPIYERVVEAPTIFEETRETVELGTRVLNEPVVSNVNTGMSNLGLREPSILHKETIITKEIFSDPNQKANFAPPTQRMI